ncbi:hypothetical protein WOLCODRAFT_64398 [Wolfiporia cocos MD-104 SS10]|uniref:Trafficking protein particle complex subunit 10 n=1 Tax=Wolfiporia cocos (strain MD-104) TaxID=742152 RepID=A0A2H3J7A8_WOLCO|nr:hypothetical protein WOLCODRAFT_64398 [Wolfiporia cocos MD-104 SS10]
MNVNSQRALVTYASSPLFLSTDHWKQVHAALLCQFPLRNLHWKPATRPNIQTIQELSVALVPFESVRDEHTSQIPQTLLERPLLNIYLVVCEDNDIYKNAIKKQIKDWHMSVSQRKNQEWLIVHIVRPDEKTAQGRIFQMKASVLDKIRADFNSDKRDRCVQLVWSPDYENPTAWAEFINKLKDGILSAFDSAFTQREEDVKRSEGQRQMPGWNFCTFFILKESLAISLEGVGLHEDALQQYVELESSFFRVLRDKNLSWFGALIALEPLDDSTSLLSVTKKPYRDLILANSISVFDFRIYLLARQCTLLQKLGLVVEICRRSVSFLGGFGRRLRELEDTLPEFFVESWTYSSALSVVDACDSWTDVSSFSKVALSRFQAVKGELLELAQQQLDIIGVRVGYLPLRPPFSIALPASAHECARRTEDESARKISKAEILQALEDKEAFYDLYVQVTNRAIELYAGAGRRKFALKLHGNLAALDLYVNWKMSWTSLESFMRLQALKIHTSTEKEKDAEWANIVLEFLKAYVEDMGQELLMDVDDHKSYISLLVQSLQAAARELKSDLLHPDHPAISMKIADRTARLAGTHDGSLLDVVVHNRLPCDLPTDEVTLIFVGPEAYQLVFSSESLTAIPPGKTTITVFCPSSAAGTFALQAFQLKVSRLILEWKESTIPAAVKSVKPTNIPVLIKIPKDLQALDVRLRPPQRSRLTVLVELGTPAKILVQLQTGRNDICTVTLKFTSPSGVKFKCDGAALEGKASFAMTADSDAIVLSDIGKELTVTMSLPHSDASSYHTLRINVDVQYITAGQPNIARSLRLPCYVPTSLPVTINVEDFFRGTRLFTRFTLSATSHQHVRIRSAQLLPSGRDGDRIKITSCQPPKPSIVNVTPAQPGKFIFQLDSSRGQAREPLKLQIAYRMLREEVEALIDMSVETIVAESPSLRSYRNALVDKIVEALAKDAGWTELYGTTGELHVPKMSGAGGELGEAMHRLEKILRESKSNDRPTEWREIVIPVDVPQMHILAAAGLRILANPFAGELHSGRILPLFAGQPISVLVTVSISFHWTPTEDAQPESYMLRYDIEDMTGEWLISGRKRGDFCAKAHAYALLLQDGTTFETAVTLIALHHGELALPKVGVSALPVPGMQHMGSMQPSCEAYQMHGAEKVLVLPRGGRSTFVVDMGQEV